MTTIPQLPAATQALRTTTLPVDQSGTTKHMTLGTLYDDFDTDVYDDYLVPAYALRSGPSAPALTAFRGGIYGLTFSGTGATVHEGMFSVHLLHGLKQGTDITFHIHWSHIIAAPTGSVRWGLEYTIARGYGAGVFAAPTTVAVVQAAGAQYSHHITNDDAITIPWNIELEPDALILGRIFRDPAHVDDTFGDDAYLLSVDVHYRRARIGTVERNRPFTSGGF